MNSNDFKVMMTIAEEFTIAIKIKDVCFTICPFFCFRTRGDRRQDEWSHETTEGRRRTTARYEAFMNPNILNLTFPLFQDPRRQTPGQLLLGLVLMDIVRRFA